MRYLFLSALVFSFLTGFSQSKFKPGYIIKNSGDTINGFLESRNLKAMGISCRFKLNNKAKISSYSAKDINGYRFNEGKFYVSKSIYNDSVVQYVFLEYLVNGIADLYYFKDKSGDRFFIQNDNDNLLELKDSKVEIVINNQHYKKANKEYIGVLLNVFKDCPEIKTNIFESQLFPESMINLTKDYHNYICKDYKCITYDRDVKSKVSLGITFGVVYSKILFNVKDYRFKFIEDEEFQLRPSYNFGLLLSRSDIFGINENLTFNFQAAYSQNNFESENFKIKQQTIYLPIYFTYHFPTGSLNPIMNFGFSNTFFLNSDVEHSNSQDREEFQKAIGNYQLSGLLGIGIQYRKNRISYFLFSNYEIGSGIIKAGFYTNNFITSETRGIGLTLGFRYLVN